MRNLTIVFGILFATLFYFLLGLMGCYILRLTGNIGQPFPPSTTGTAWIIVEVLAFGAIISLFRAAKFLSGEEQLTF